MVIFGSIMQWDPAIARVRFIGISANYAHQYLIQNNEKDMDTYQERNQAYRITR